MVDPRDIDLDARRARERAERSELEAQTQKAIDRLREIDRLRSDYHYDLRHGFISPSDFARRVGRLNVEDRELRRQLGIR